MRNNRHARYARPSACGSILVTAILCSLWSAGAAQDKSGAAGEWEQLQKAGTEAFEAARYGDAERLLTRAVIKAGSFGESDIRFAKSLGELGRLYTVRARFTDAEPLLEEELRVREAVVGKDSLEIVPAMSSLIQFYLAHGTTDKADPLSEDVLALVSGKLQERAAQAQGSVHFKKGQPLTGWAGVAAPSARDPLLDLAITCDALADAHRAKGKHELAERLYRAALEIKTSVLGSQHLSLANSYDSLGSLYFERNDYPQADLYFTNAFEITEGILPPDNPQVYARLDKLAKCLIKENKLDQAEKLYLKAQNFWRDEPSHSGNEARAKYALGNLYADEKKFDEAAPVLKQALEMAQQYYGEDSISLVPYLQRYAYALYYLGQRDETDRLKTRADAIAGVGVAQ